MLVVALSAMLMQYYAANSNAGAIIGILVKRHLMLRDRHMSSQSAAQITAHHEPCNYGASNSAPVEVKRMSVRHTDELM